MPSPSKIPRPRFGERKQTVLAPGVKVQIDRNAAKVEHPSAVQTKQTKLVKPKFVKSPLRENPENKIKQMSQKEQKNVVLNDRRGISEIKRSEHNLRVKVDLLQNDLDSMKQELSAMKNQVDEKAIEVSKLQEKGRDSEILIEKLKEEKEIQSRIFEKLNIDPVTKTKLEPTETFESLLTMQKNSKQSELNSVIDEFEEQIRKLGSRVDEI